MNIQMKESIKEMIDSGKLDEAKALIKEYESIIDKDVDIFSMKSIIALMENRFHDAEFILKKGLKIDSQNIDLLYNMAYLFQVKENYLMALYYYNQVLLNSKSNSEKEEIKVIISELNGKLNINKEDKDSNTQKPPLVSIVILAYNHLKYTRECVESILKYTSHIDFELIAVNNGSTDGTKEYFDSLPRTKAIHLDENVGPVNGFNIGMKEATGKYTASVCNDFVFTKNWLDNLLNCIESDGKIGFVSPGGTNVSNNQGIGGHLNNVKIDDVEGLERIHKYANSYNNTDPSKWEERVRLLPCVLMVRTSILKEIGYFDPIFRFGEFADDDISFRIRRAGYKLVFARDTFVHHFGSITTSKDQLENDSLNISRKIFIDKYDIDTWLDTGCNNHILNEIDYNTKDKVNILGINTLCGATPLQIKNKFRELGTHNIHISNITDSEKYMVDLKTVSDNAVLGKIDDISYLFKNQKFDYIIIESGLERYSNVADIFSQLNELLIEDGKIIINIENLSFYKNLYSLLKGKVPCNNNYLASYFDITKMQQLLKDTGFQNISVLGCRDVQSYNIQTINAFSSIVESQDKALVEKLISIKNFLISATR